MVIVRQSVERVDLSDLRCPYVARRVRKALARASVGEILEFICTDPLAAIDVPHLVKLLGDELISHVCADDRIRFVIRRSARPSDLGAGA